MLTALRHLHLRRIVHCDLKPENILCHEHHGTLKLKLADWGFAQVFSAIFFFQDFTVFLFSKLMLCSSSSQPNLIMFWRASHAVSLFHTGAKLAR